MEQKSFTRFIIVWIGQLLSGIGSGMTAFAFGIQVYEQTNSAAGFASILLASFMPSILLGPLGGILADRFDRRVMIIIGDAGAAVSVLFLLLNCLSGRLSLWYILPGVAAGSAFSALQVPAYKASLSDLLSESEYAKAGGLVQLASSARHLLSPVAAGILLSLSGIINILLLDIASFIIAVAAVFALPGKNRRIKTGLTLHLSGALKESRLCLSENSGVKQVVYKLAAVTFFAGCIQVLITPMLLFITDTKTLGIIQSISASGMVAGSIFVSLFGLKIPPLRVLHLGLIAGGASLSLLGTSTNLFFITITFFLFYLTLPFINTSAEVWIRNRITNERQGRIWGIVSFTSQSGYLAAYVTAGFLSDKVFSPLLSENGVLSDSIGRVIGTGPGRGSAFILVLCGLGMIITSLYRSGGVEKGEKNEIKIPV
ncbi:MAG: MFS transporter [Spirochaetales bacterium]|uniref:MFS transporter n=1 Tax=Candidatus Thalassospirochaeta sargassi TaxID=3119039 RepID=A0AAJ1IDW1_9SPIO|nr:MFS transporter [Spirochaetales bacterium]